jgi:hypothetical protein
MAIKRSFALALLGVLTVAVVAPVGAQTTPPPARPRRTTPRTPRAERRAERMNNTNSGMTGRTVPVSTANNTAVVQGNITNANKTLSDMVALLDQIEARKKPGTTTPAAQ